MPTKRRAALRRAAVTSAAAGIALGLIAAPAAACPKHRQGVTRVKGPTHTYHRGYSAVKEVVTVHGARGRTVVDLRVSGFPRSAAGKRFGAHVHQNKCGPKASHSGTHYQRLARSSTPLRFKEIWLDVRIDRDGRGHSRAVVPWRVAKGQRSVVIHAKPTDRRTGEAGARLLCTTVPFGR
ncbi:hypothetical protein [Actinomadura rugatobispora]|uniref:Superoxide dismutase family protein n=1 Tax=Actinomadura rugatobispora TaxID=1994 RepID=A0ABW1A810_9ACTN|nr:hypothetical protein GCM10010200_063230 [Actinomadura rugatobispora]